MEKSPDLHNSSLDKLSLNSEINSVDSYVNNEHENVISVCDRTDKDKCISSNTLAESEKEAKSSRISSVLASYCNTLNESSDFIECELMNKFKSASQKNKRKELSNGSQVNEVMICEICKEDITTLDFYNRGIHVNNCIDKQISSTAEITSQTSTVEVTSQISTSENAFILECPLCFKHFLTPELRSTHIKKCGKSKGLSLQSILKALELQERHILERISLGLPAKKVKPIKMPKNPVIKKAIVQPKNKAQSDIQLAKALSLSLANSAQQDDSEINQQVTSVILKPPTANQRPGKKTKFLTSTPLLVLRSNEDRKKLLLDKVAGILTLAIDPSPLKGADVTTEKQRTGDQDEFTLWYLSSKSSDKCQYYVEELLDWIKPSDVEMGDKLFHLSQIAGHEIVTQLPCEYTFSIQEENIDTEDQASSVLPITNQHSSLVIESLSSLVASSWMSDVDIQTACGTVIPAHKLLLTIRCPPLKQDTQFCSGNGRASLRWENVSFDAALQFLNFIYTGKIDVKRCMMSDLFYLANRYEVFDLQAVLNANNNDDTKSKIVGIQGIPKSENQSYFPSSSYHIETAESAENTVCKSQEDTNMDLDIVCNCINSTLKPSQLTNTQPTILGDMAPFKCTDEPMPEKSCDVSCKTDDDEHDSASNCDNLSLKNSGSTSPVIFDFSDSDNDANDRSCETAQCIINCSQKSASGPSNVDTESLDLYTIESNSSDDSVKFLQSSYSSHNNICSTSEKVQKLPLFSPKDSVISCSPTISNSSQNPPVSNQDRYEEKIMPSEIEESDGNVHDKLKSQSIPYSQVSVEKKCDLTPDKCKKDICVELESPVASYSQRLHSDFYSHCEDTTLGAEVKDDSKSFNGDLLVNKNLKNESSKTISSADNEALTYSDLVSRKYNNDETFKLSFKNSSCKINTISIIKSDDNTILKSPVINSGSPEVLICDSDSDAKLEDSVLHERSPLHDYQVNSPPKSIKSDDGNPPNSPLSSGKSSHEVSSNPLHPINDAVFESFYHFNHEISLLNEDRMILNDSKNMEEKAASACEYNLQSPKCSKISEKLHVVPVTDCLKSPKISKYSKKGQTDKTATPLSASEIQKPKFKFSDSPITPLPDYKNMMTPQIKEALKRIGVKPLPRKKALAILSHVYDETHPLIDAKTNTVSQAAEVQSTKADKVIKPKKRKQTTKSPEKPAKQQKENHSKEAVLASPESDESGSENPEWLGCVPEMSFSQSNHDSPTKPSTGDIESIKLYIQSNEELYYNVLNYKPLNLVEFHQELKINGMKISIQKLMDFLDEQCITFTCPRKEETKKKQTARTQRFRKNMIAKLSQQTS